MQVPQAIHILRCLKKKLVLVLILILSAAYSLYSFSTKNNFLESAVRTKLDFVKSFQDDTLFTWNPKSTEIDEMVPPAKCRNSLQGKDFIVDDLGYICRRADVLPNGCCFTNTTFTKRYVCDSCLANNCCEVYEHCLSCCLNPNKRLLLESILKKMSSRFQFILSETKDQYELCSVKCRTNSKSVHQGNTYRNPDHKYCYGDLLETRKRKCNCCYMMAVMLYNMMLLQHKLLVLLRYSHNNLHNGTHNDVTIIEAHGTTPVAVTMNVFKKQMSKSHIS